MNILKESIPGIATVVGRPVRVFETLAKGREETVERQKPLCRTNPNARLSRFKDSASNADCSFTMDDGHETVE